MSINWKSKLLTLAAVTTLYAALLPGTVSAQTLASAGSDLYTRLLWKTSNGSVSLWLLDPAMNYVSYRAYGPYLGWEPLGISTGADNYTRMLWKYTDGTISLWLLDPDLNFVTYKQFGPYPTYIPETVSALRNGYTSVLWKRTDGEIQVWLLDNNFNFVQNKGYGPYFGYDPKMNGAKATTDNSKLPPEMVSSQSTQPPQ